MRQPVFILNPKPQIESVDSFDFDIMEGGLVRVNYTYSNEIYLPRFNKNFSINLYIKSDSEKKSFFNYLTNELKQSGINRKIYNLYSIAKVLVSKRTFKPVIEFHKNNDILNAENKTCTNCWAKNICWITKSFASFNIDLLNVESYTDECNLIKSLIENVVYQLRILNNDQADTFEFDGSSIRLIN